MKAADLELLTFVNGEKASDGAPLAEGDLLTFDLKGFVPGRSIWGHDVTLEIDGQKGPSLSPEDLRNGTALTAPAFDTSLSGCLGSGRYAVYGATFVPAAAEPAPDPQPEPGPEPVSAPVAKGALDDLILVEGSEARTVDAAKDFVGEDLVYALVAAPSGVSLEVATGLVTIDPDKSGLLSGATVVIRASNAAGSADSAFSLTVEAPANTAPVAVGDSATVTAGATVRIDVLANDLDLDGDTLSVVDASSDMGRVSIGDAPGYVLTFDAADLSGGETSTVSYTISDGTNTDTGRVEITVEAVEQPAIPSDGPADFTVTSDAEWDEALAKPTSELDGKIMEVSGSDFTSRSVGGHSFPTGFTIRSADAASKIPRLEMEGTLSKLNIRGLNIQVPGWPKRYGEAIYFGSGTYRDIIIEASHIRHGYGPDLVDFDTAAELPECERVHNILNATTISQAHELKYQDHEATGGRLYVFNRGTEPVYVAIGGPDVTVGYSNKIAAGRRLRLDLDRPGDTHIALRSASGVQEVNARTEIGLHYYLASGFFTSGAADITNLTIKNNLFTDLGNAIKFGAKVKGDFVVWGNKTKRIYMDNIGCAPEEKDGTMYSFFNELHNPFCKSGIDEHLEGDANDPHGDNHQMFGRGNGPISNVYSAGNVTVTDHLRDNCVNQGLFWSDNDFNPSYRNVFSIADIFTAGAPNGIASGEGEAYPVDGFLIYGTTLLDAQKSGSRVNIRISGDNAVAHSCIVSGKAQGNVVSENTIYADGEGIDRYFANFSKLREASTVEEVIVALEAQGEAAELGAAYHRSRVLDPNTDDYKSVIKWDMIPSGIAWPDYEAQLPHTEIVTKLCRIVNPRRSQSVVPGDGVEWRSVDTDGVTEVQPWTTGDGVIEQDQYIQIRFTTPNGSLARKDISILVNGFDEGLMAITKLQIDQPKILGNAVFTDVEPVPSGTTRIEYEAEIVLNTPSNDSEIFGQRKYIRCGIAEGKMRFWSIRDAAGTNVFSDTFYPGFKLGENVRLYVDIDYEQEHVRVRKNNEEFLVKPFTRSSSVREANSSESLNLFSYADNPNLPTDTLFGYGKIWLTTNGVRMLHKELNGTADEINSSPWLKSGAVTTE